MGALARGGAAPHNPGRHANLHFVTPQLAVGGDLDPCKAADQLADLDSLGITHVVDCRGEWTDQDVFAEHLPTWATCTTAWTTPVRTSPPRGSTRRSPGSTTQARCPSPDHCHMGINRGPSLGFAVLLHQGWDPVEAIAAIRAARPIANVWCAGDSLAWHHARHRTDPSADLLRLKAWRAANPLAVVRIIRRVREQEVS